MTPARKGDGTGLSFPGYSEVRTGDGTVVWTAGADIPDSAVSQWDASQESFSNDDTVNTATDFIGGNDLSGAATFKSNIQNGNPVFRFNGTDNFLNTSITAESIPYSFTAVCVNIPESEDGALTDAVFGRGDPNDDYYGVGWRYGKWGYEIGGAGIGGAAASPPVILTWVVKATDDAVLRVNGSVGSDGTGNDIDVASIEMGGLDDGTDAQLDGDIGELVFYNDELTSAEIDAEEQRLSDKWGITI